MPSWGCSCQYWRAKKPALQCSARCFPLRRPVIDGPSDSPTAPEGRRRAGWATELQPTSSRNCGKFHGYYSPPGVAARMPHGAAAADIGAVGSQRCKAVRGASHGAGLSEKGQATLAPPSRVGVGFSCAHALAGLQLQTLTRWEASAAKQCGVLPMAPAVR